jgi:hypothetical protein
LFWKQYHFPGISKMVYYFKGHRKQNPGIHRRGSGIYEIR